MTAAPYTEDLFTANGEYVKTLTGYRDEQGVAHVTGETESGQLFTNLLNLEDQYRSARISRLADRPASPWGWRQADGADAYAAHCRDALYAAMEQLTPAQLETYGQYRQGRI